MNIPAGGTFKILGAESAWYQQRFFKWYTNSWAAYSEKLPSFLDESLMANADELVMKTHRT